MRIRYLEKLPKPVDEASGQLGTSFTAIASVSGANSDAVGAIHTVGANTASEISGHTNAVAYVDIPRTDRTKKRR
jgi:predicted metal-dependent enzyme (double-stranded beta helix superfamily)